jgi:thiamine biosynthesis protein ThiI
MRNKNARKMKPANAKRQAGARKIIVKYGELWLKSEPVKMHFARALTDNIRSSFKSNGIHAFKIVRLRDMMEVESPSKKALEILKRTFGISWFAEAVESKPEMRSMEKAVLGFAKRIGKSQTFAIRASRQDKSLPFTSRDIEIEMGKRIDRKVDLSKPDVTIYLEAKKDKVYVYAEKIKGAGGMPYGVSGRVLSLVSGGIDSPVASWLMMKRGCSVDFVHFSVEEKDDAKVVNILKALAEYAPAGFHLYSVPYKAIQESITRECNRHFTCVLCKRIMYRTAEKIANEVRAKALVTGENLAQVASQTLDNLVANEGVVSLPILRPLLGMDKEETIALAKRIGTFEPSIARAKPCAFVPFKPATKARGEVVAAEEKRIKNLGELIKEAVASAKKVGI